MNLVTAASLVGYLTRHHGPTGIGTANLDADRIGTLLDLEDAGIVTSRRSSSGGTLFVLAVPRETALRYRDDLYASAARAELAAAALVADDQIEVAE